MKKILGLALLVMALGVWASAKSVEKTEREPAQMTFPGGGTNTGNPPVPAGSDEILSANTNVSSVSCLGNWQNSIQVTGSSNRIRIVRISGADIRYEVYRDSRFLASCSQIVVQ